MLTLTDDEVVAIAIAGNTFYAGDLPTVDAGSEEGLLQASLRGRRSLVARDWIDESGALAPELGLAVDTAGSERFINVFLGDEELSRIDWSLATSLYARGADWVIEAVDGIGLHRFAAVAESDAHAALHALAAGAYADAAEHAAPDGAWLMVSVPQPDGGQVLAARPGTYRTATIDAGRLSPWSAVTAEDARGWIDAALASVRVSGPSTSQASRD